MPDGNDQPPSEAAIPTFDDETLREWGMERGIDPESLSFDELVDRLVAGELSGEPALRAIQHHVADDPERADRLATAVEPGLDGDEDERIAAASALAGLAGLHPDAVADAVPSLVEAAHDETIAVKNYAATALGTVGDARPGAVRDAIPRIAPLLDDEFRNVRERAVQALAGASEAHPDAVRPFVADLVAVVTAVDTPGGEGAELLAEHLERERQAADDRPGSGVATGGSDPPENVPDPVRTLREESMTREVHHHLTREQAAIAIANVAADEPGAVADHVGALVSVLDRDEVVDTRTAILNALYPVAEADPDALDDLDPIAVVLAEDEYPELGAAAARVLAALAEHRLDAVAAVVEPRIDDVARLFDAETPGTRGAAIGLLAYVAEAAPDAVGDVLPEVVELLDDDAAFVRGSAVWTLRFAEGEAGRDALRDVAANDPDEEVRALAAEALDGSEG